jgi:hypothetical protein
MHDAPINRRTRTAWLVHFVSTLTLLTTVLTLTNINAQSSDPSGAVYLPLIQSANPTQQTGAWRERILNADGSINWAEWEYVAKNYHSAEIVNYRLGPITLITGRMQTRASRPSISLIPRGSGKVAPIKRWPTGSVSHPTSCLRARRRSASSMTAVAAG